MKNLKITAPLVIIALIAIICVGIYLVYALVIGSQPIERTSINSISDNSSSFDETECLAKGGEWGNIGLNLTKECNLPNPDAGKECISSSDCRLGSCFAESQQSITGKCSTWQKTAGCNSLMENGKALPKLCLD